MPPRQEKRGRGRGKRPRDDEEPKSPHSTGFSAINSPPIASTSQAGFGQQLPIQSTQAPPGKVAIPALKNPRITESSKALKKGRNPHACDFCRKAKAGCTGGNPCTRCLNAHVPCVYGDGKRDKDKKRMTKLSKESVSLSRHNEDVAEALRRIRLDTNLSTEDIMTAIDGVLLMAPHPTTPDEENHPTTSRDSSDADEEEPISGNEDVDMEIGSTGSLDVTNVNTDRDDTRATGHLGKSSSVAWAKRTAEACLPEIEPGNASSKPPKGLGVSSYHTEDGDLEDFDLSDIDCFVWPDRKLADALVSSYFETVHKSLPLVDKFNFMSKYEQFDRNAPTISPEDIIWLGTLNTIFAISAVYAHLTKSPHRDHYCDHLVFITRAKILCLGQGFLYEDARVSTTTGLGLLCLYFIATSRLNRAWAISGLAIRHAVTLGLHIRIEAGDLSDYDNENRVRLWWSLYSLECLLNELTGRPSCISDQDISTPLPLNIDEEEFRPGKSFYGRAEDTRHASGPPSRRSSRSSKDGIRRPSATYQMPHGIGVPLPANNPALTLPETTSTYFIYRTQLSIISHEIVTQVYCAATIKESWVEVQNTIKRIDARLKAWRDNLPADFTLDFDRYVEPDWDDPHALPRMGLAMLYNSSRMILFRPCLCKFEGRISTQSEKSMDFNRQGVEMCIHSARTMINLIGWTARDVAKVYAVTPWWHTLHYLCEALSVLMLELAYQAQHLPAEAGYILDDAKKGIRWLIMMSEESISARKAWEIFDTLIRLVAPRINWSVFDLPTTAPTPLGFKWRKWRAVSGNALISEQQMPRTESLQHFAELDPELDPRTSTQVQTSAAPWPAHTFGYQPSATYAPSIYGQELISNQLDQERAVQMFGSIGALHGHYDEPWNHMFGASVPGAMSLSHGSGIMMPPPPPPSDGTMGEQQGGENTFGAGQFGGGQYGHQPFEGMGGNGGRGGGYL
ncbi:hypothetical protein ONS96_001059 [Cadophora gregata f. sp. sojae]|nr:hypothetical protein ONS96_001059 [Cadophora gregata f. sp. sojae]